MNNTPGGTSMIPRVHRYSNQCVDNLGRTPNTAASNQHHSKHILHAPRYPHLPCRPPTQPGVGPGPAAPVRPGADRPRHPLAQAGAPRCADRRPFQPRRRNPSGGPRAARRLWGVLRSSSGASSCRQGRGRVPMARCLPQCTRPPPGRPAGCPGVTAQQTVKRPPRTAIPGEYPALPGCREPARTHRPRTSFAPNVPIAHFSFWCKNHQWTGRAITVDFRGRIRWKESQLRPSSDFNIDFPKQPIYSLRQIWAVLCLLGRSAYHSGCRVCCLAYHRNFQHRQAAA